ncbi:MAG: hypothetical protein ACQESR_30690 [Planctomycetota bacterium]
MIVIRNINPRLGSLRQVFACNTLEDCLGIMKGWAQCNGHARDRIYKDDFEILTSDYCVVYDGPDLPGGLWNDDTERAEQVQGAIEDQFEARLEAIYEHCSEVMREVERLRDRVSESTAKLAAQCKAEDRRKEELRALRPFSVSNMFPVQKNGGTQKEDNGHE